MEMSISDRDISVSDREISVPDRAIYVYLYIPTAAREIYVSDTEISVFERRIPASADQPISRYQLISRSADKHIG